MSHEFDDRALKDEEFDEYLRRGSEVSQRYQELGAREVPPALDAKVLRQAQQQATKSSGWRRPWLRWGTPLALAATALIAITVVMQPDVNAPRAPEPMIESQRVESQVPESQVPELPASESQKLADGASVADPKREIVDSDSALSDALQTPRAVELEPAPATQPAAQPGASGSASVRANSSSAQNRAVRDERAAAAARERDVQRALESSSAPAEPARPNEELEAAARSGERRMARAPEAVSQPALDEIAAASGEESKAKRKQEEGAARSDAAPALPAAPAPAAPPSEAAAGLLRAQAAGPPPPEPAPKGVSTLEADRAIAPAAWIRWIRDFRAQGNQARAEELLTRLRAAHPSFELPADIASPSQQR